MKTILYIILVILAITLLMTSCTQNQKARSYGGTETVNLPKGEKLINATWKGDKGGADLWYLTEAMDSSYIPKKKYFRESSGYGVFEGTVIFIESK